MKNSNNVFWTCFVVDHGMTIHIYVYMDKFTPSRIRPAYVYNANCIKIHY